MTAVSTPTFTTHLECSLTGEIYPADTIQGLSAAGKPLLVRYDLESLAQTVSQAGLARRTEGLWRYREFLPVRRPENRISLGEVMTPLIELPRVAGKGGRLIVKDEGRLPTGSFKARGLALAVSMAKELGLDHLAMPTNGNAGAAMAAYARRAGMRCTVFCPDDTPEINVNEIQFHGGDVWRVNGLINDCGALVGAGKEQVGWFDCSTLKEPYRVEGKKTMGLELAEQMNWRLPDVIFYPTGGGTGLIGMWKAFAELRAVGWLPDDVKLPRMVAVQSTGCAPIVRAWERGEDFAPLWENAHTVAAGIRVPVAVGDFLIIRAIDESRGFAIAVDDEAILAAGVEVAQTEGLMLCPEGAATYAAWKQALADRKIGDDDTAVLFNCATGIKYPMPTANQSLDRHREIDWEKFR